MFERVEKIFGKENIQILKNTNVLVLGLGGVGSFAVETLVRNGIGNIILVDSDKVELTNKNRQIIALNSSMDKYKVDVMEDRIKDINENCNVIKINKFISENNICELFKNNVDFIIDACDTIPTKILLIKECINKNINLISSMGTANKVDSTKLKITELKKTQYDPIAKIIRKKLRDENINDKVVVLSSDEMQIKTMDKKLGSYSVVPNIAGIMLADYVIKEILKRSVQKM